MNPVTYILFITLVLAAVAPGPIMTKAYTPEFPVVEYCKLIGAAESYDGKEIRIHGTYMIAGADVSTFYSPSCDQGRKLWVEFNPGYQSCSSSKTVKLLNEMKQKSGARWARPHVTVVTSEFRSAEVEFLGTFLRTNPFKSALTSRENGPLGPILTDRQRADFVFRVSCVAALKPLSTNAGRAAQAHQRSATPSLTADCLRCFSKYF